jgi:hypothetical protein
MGRPDLTGRASDSFARVLGAAKLLFSEHLCVCVPVTLWTRIREVFGSGLARDTVFTKFYHVVPQLGHDRFLPDPFPVHYSPA